MSEKRKKFTLYLSPDNEADQEAMNVIASVSRMSRGELFRNAFVTGLALQRLDSRLPALISTLFNGQLTADQLVGLLSQTTNWKPSQADIRTVIKELSGQQVVMPPVDVPEDEEKQAMDAARKKLAGLL